MELFASHLQPEIGSNMQRFGLATLCVSVLLINSAYSHDLWLASGREFPGRLRLSEGGTVSQVIHSRNDTPNPAYPNAVMKVAQIAVGPNQAVYFCSGLDGSLMHLLDGHHEIQSFEVAGQIRDLACTSEDHTVYYSVVPTPQDIAPLSDGHIYRRDLWEGNPQLVATIRQADVGGNWWGTFTIRDSEIYLATIYQPSRLFKWSSGTLAPEFPANQYHIKGLSVSTDGDFLFVDGSGKVWQTRDFSGVSPVLETPLGLTDVSHRALQTTVRP